VYAQFNPPSLHKPSPFTNNAPEIPPSNWGPEYWKIFEKIIKGQKKKKLII